MQIRSHAHAVGITVAYVAVALGLSLWLISRLAEFANLQLNDHPTVYLALGVILALAVTPPTWLSARQQFRHTLTHRQQRPPADLDPLTGLLNRPAFVQQSTELIQQVPQNKHYTLLLVDLDFFPEFSETYGNLEADRVLQHFAAHLAARVRDNDLFCRLDRESFALLLVGANLAQATRLAERMVSAIAQRPFSNEQRILEFTASCGYADSISATTFDALHAHAASALLQAKRQGHNRAVAYHPPYVANSPASASLDEKIVQ
jgi:diguanylate cyclase (GGDEF)-like protein